MTLRAGSTLYFRVIHDNREFWIVDGYSMHDNDMCWKVKRDRVSGRFFFVNMGVHGKKWRLPDVYDPRFGDESIFPKHLHGKHSRSGPGENAFGADGLALTPFQNNSSRHDLTSPGTPPPPFSGGGAASGAAADDSPFATFDYGGDLLNSSPLRKIEAQQQREALDKRRQDERRQEELMMRNGSFAAAGGGRNPQFNNTSFDSRGSAVGRSHFHPSHHDLELTLEQEQARHRAEVERSLQDTRRLEQSVSRQRERNDELLGKEMELTSELEKQQLHNIEEHAQSVLAHVEHLRRTPSPAMAGVQQQHFSQPNQQPPQGAGDVADTASSASGPQSHSASVLPGGGGGGAMMMVQPSPSRGRSSSAAAGGGGMMMMMPQPQGPGIMFTTGTVDPCVVLQEQLDLERRRNEELREELVRKDRIILGAQLSEVERERRDMNLRLRCLEAMAAYRAKTQKALQNQTQYLQSEQF